MKTIKYLLISILIFSSCHEDIPDLELNPLEDESLVLLKIIDHEYLPQWGRLEANFEVNYDYQNNFAIKGIIVIRNGEDRVLISDPSQTYFLETNLATSGTVCYELAFLVGDDERVRQTNDNYCIEL